MKDLLQLTVPERIKLIYTEKDPYYIYLILSKYLKISIDELQLLYELKLDYIKNILEVRGSHVPIYNLFELTIRLGLPFDGFNTNFIRYNLSVFIQKLR